MRVPPRWARDDTQDVKPRNSAGVLGRLTLTVRKVRGHRDDRLRDLLSEIALRVRLEFGENHRGNLLGRVGLVVDFHLVIAAHFALDGADRAVGIDDSLTLCNLTDEPFPVLLKSHDGRRGARPLGIGNDDGLRALYDRHAGVGGAEIDTDNFRHNLFPPRIIY